MARTPAQRGPFGRWLTRVRTERYERQVDALEAMRKLAGLHISQAEYSQWESGSRVPREDNPKVARLYEFFGSRPDEETAPPVGEAGEIAAAIERQTQAIVAAIQARDQTIVDLLSELARYRLQQAGLVETVVAALEQRGTEGRSDDPEPAPRAPVLEPVRQG